MTMKKYDGIPAVKRGISHNLKKAGIRKGEEHTTRIHGCHSFSSGFFFDTSYKSQPVEINGKTYWKQVEVPTIHYWSKNEETNKQELENIKAVLDELGIKYEPTSEKGTHLFLLNLVDFTKYGY